MDLNAVAAIAGQEARISLRNKWTLVFAAAFGTLALAISYFGLVTAGFVGFQGFSRTAVSLLNLVLYLVPIVSLTMGALSLTGERGASELLFSQPVSRAEILLGKLLGLFASVGAAMLFGFGLAGLVIASQAGGAGLLPYLAFVGLALLLAAIFLSLGVMAAVLAGTKAKALSLALGLWFFFVLFYDLVVIGLTFLLREKAANLFIFASLFGNPVDMVRVFGLIALSDATIFGAAGAALMKTLGGAVAGGLVLLAALAAWAAAPFALANRVLRGRDI